MTAIPLESFHLFCNRQLFKKKLHPPARTVAAHSVERRIRSRHLDFVPVCPLDPKKQVEVLVGTCLHPSRECIELDDAPASCAICHFVFHPYLELATKYFIHHIFGVFLEVHLLVFSLCSKPLRTFSSTASNELRSGSVAQCVVVVVCLYSVCVFPLLQAAACWNSSCPLETLIKYFTPPPTTTNPAPPSQDPTPPPNSLPSPLNNEQEENAAL